MIPDGVLVERYGVLSGRIKELQARQDTKDARRQRSVDIGAGSAVGIVGLLLAPPTGGLTLILTAGGLWLCVRGLRADAEIMNKDLPDQSQLPALEREFREVQEELRRRGLLP